MALSLLCMQTPCTTRVRPSHMCNTNAPCTATTPRPRNIINQQPRTFSSWQADTEAWKAIRFRKIVSHCEKGISVMGNMSIWRKGQGFFVCLKKTRKWSFTHCKVPCLGWDKRGLAILIHSEDYMGRAIQILEFVDFWPFSFICF